jgi:hypothetical protein
MSHSIYPKVYSIYLAMSWALVGLIWIVQLVHYPSFQYVADSTFLDFHKHHTFSISLIVVPLMLIELSIGIWLWIQNKGSLYTIIPLCLLCIIWVSTFSLQVPIHNNLVLGKNVELIEQLVSTNWIRTLSWTVKGLWITFVFDRIKEVTRNDT